MRIFCLGGAGRICREAALDLIDSSDCERVTIGDIDASAGFEVVRWLADSRVDFVKTDVTDHAATVGVLSGYDVVMDGTGIRLNGLSTRCIAAAGCHGINLNGFGDEDASDADFRANDRACVAGFGMTPGLTQLLAMEAAQQMDTVDTVRISHGAYRPIAFSDSIAETTVYEYDPELPDRVVYEDGRFVQVPPFARPLEVELPPPYGWTTQYIIPHAETRTLARSLAHKNVRLVEVRGTWPEPNMRLLRALHEWGFLRNEEIEVGGSKAGIMDCVARYLRGSSTGNETPLYGYALHVDVSGEREGRPVQVVATTHHPASDGSVPGWEKLRAYTRNVGIPLAVGALLLAQGRVARTGVISPEEAFVPQEVFAALQTRGIEIDWRVATGLEPPAAE